MARTPATAETRIQQLIIRHQLNRITLSTPDGRRFWTTAYPEPWSKVVSERRAVALLGENSPAALSIAEATAISLKAATDPLCRGGGDTIILAVESLAGALNALDDKRDAGSTAPEDLPRVAPFPAG